jgi:hypothetical protein
MTPQDEIEFNQIKKDLLYHFNLYFLSLSLCIFPLIYDSSKKILLLLIMTILLMISTYALVIGWFHLFLSRIKDHTKGSRSFWVIAKYLILFTGIFLILIFDLFDLFTMLLSVSVWVISMIFSTIKINV